MSDFHQRFIAHLRLLSGRDRGALAALRRSLAFAPGAHAPAMPFVEPFAARDSTREAQRQALYLAAGLYAANPRQRTGQSLGAALAVARRRRKSESIERRFLALLGADAEGVAVHLRHANSLLAAEELGCDYAALAADLESWLDPWNDELRDRVRQRWARDFYHDLAAREPEAASADNTSAKEDAP